MPDRNSHYSLPCPFLHHCLPSQRKIFVKEAACHSACDFEADTLSLLMQVPKYQEMSAGRVSWRTFPVQSMVLKTWPGYALSSLLPLFLLPLPSHHLSLPLPFGAI